MVVVTVDKPRPGTGVSLREFKRRGADVLLIGLTPGAQGSVAAVKWRNPQVNFTSQQPAAMELVLLRELPHAEGGRTQDAAATRVLLRDLLDSVPPGTLKYVHIFDKQAGAAYSTSLGGNLSIEAIVRRNHAELLAAVQGLPVTHLGNVVSSALSRTLHLSSAKLKQLVALQTALAIFPQATGQIKSMAKHKGLVQALLVVAHVIGARVQREAEDEGAAPPEPTAGAAVAAVAAGAAGLHHQEAAAAGAADAGGGEATAAGAAAGAAAAGAEPAAIPTPGPVARAGRQPQRGHGSSSRAAARAAEDALVIDLT